jgi:hypothetical protein
MLICIALSGALLLYSSLQKVSNPWLVVILGGAPLVIFHWFILTPNGEAGLNSTEIDSVYYFGFLVTLGALGVGAISVSPAEPNATSRILSHFGVGLTTTGYAVVARLHLTSIGLRGDLETVEDALSRQMQGSQQLLDQMTIVVAEAAQLSTSIQQVREEFARQAADGWQDLNRTIIGKVTDEIGGLLSAANDLSATTRDSVISLRATIDPAFVNQIESVSTAMVHLSSASEELTTTLKQTALSAAKDDIALKDLRDALVDVTSNLNGIDSVTSAMANLTDTTNSAASVFSMTASELTASTQTLAKASAELGVAPRAFQRLSTVAERVLQVLQTTGVVIERIRQQSDDLVQAGDRLVSLGNSSSDLDSKLRAASAAIADVEQEFVKLGPTASTAQEAIGALGSAQVLFAQTGKSLERILGGLEGSPVLVDTLKRLDDFAGRLGHSSEGLTKTIDGLSGRLGSTNSALERDATRSAELILQLEQRLVKLVEAIISQTLRRQGVGL